ncbi:MAG: sensor histidine kinase [Butyricicoccus sp.]
MIQKLRRKFVLSNMLLVSLALLVVFIAVCAVYHQMLRGETEQALQQAISMRIGDEKRKPLIGKPMEDGRVVEHVPVFSVLLDAEGGIRQIDGREDISITDQTIESAVTQAQQSAPAEGTLADMSLRYLRQDTPDGIKIAFADISHERTGMRSMFLISLLTFVLSLAAFFLISLFLARQTLRPVEEAWAQQRRFVADASHELKTPITVILANLGVLLAHPDELIRDNRQWVDNSREEAVRMKGLVEDMLFLARSNVDQTPMVTERVNLSDLLWSSLLSFEPVAFEQGVELHSTVEPEIFVQGAAGQLQQLFAVLLDNAVKYAGEHGKVWVNLRKKDGKTVLTVRNTGDPIPPDSLAHVFDRFYRVDEARTRERGGYGLGLAIAQRIAEGHGGRITAESSRENGTVFTVIL